MLRLFGSGSLGVFSGSLGGSFGRSLNFFLGASLGGALAGSFFALGSFSVNLLSFTLFEALLHSSAASVEDNLYRLCSGIVSVDYDVDV